MYALRPALQQLSGRRRPSAIRRWLEREKIPYLLDADDWPQVADVVIMERLGGPVAVPTVEPELILE